MSDIGKHIRLLRTQQNMTQDELAQKLFVSRQTISNYETGKSQPDIDMLLRISEALGVGAEAILYGISDTLEQITQKKRAIGCCFAVAGLAVVYHLLVQVRKSFLSPRFLLAGLGYSLALLLRPALFLLAGWTFMQLLSVLTKLRPLQSRRARSVFWTVLAILILYIILILPMCGWALWSDLEVLQLYLSGEGFNYSRSFSIAPWWDAAVHWLTVHYKIVSPVFPLAGATLWLTGKHKATPPSEAPSTSV